MLTQNCLLTVFTFKEHWQWQYPLYTSRIYSNCWYQTYKKLSGEEENHSQCSAKISEYLDDGSLALDCSDLVGLTEQQCQVIWGTHHINTTARSSARVDNLIGVLEDRLHDWYKVSAGTAPSAVANWRYWGHPPKTRQQRPDELRTHWRNPI